MEDVKVSVIGLGVMGEAIVKVLIEAGLSQSNIAVKEKRSERLEEVKSKYKLISEDLAESKIIFLAVKPQDLDSGLESIRREVQSETLIVSIVAGVSCSRVESYIGKNSRVIRVMPNTALIVKEGVSAISRGRTAQDEDLAWVEGIFSKSGKTLTIDESLMDAVTATSGSGPAYFFGLIEAMTKASIRLGLSEQDSKLLVNQTLIGAAKMIEESGKDAGTLRKEVTSPNGTTAAALTSFESSGWEEIVYEAMKAAKDRSQELSN